MLQRKLKLKNKFKSKRNKFAKKNNDVISEREESKIENDMKNQECFFCHQNKGDNFGVVAFIGKYNVSKIILNTQVQ